jgi:hypothetical protein
MSVFRNIDPPTPHRPASLFDADPIRIWIGIGIARMPIKSTTLNEPKPEIIGHRKDTFLLTKATAY